MQLALSRQLVTHTQSVHTAVLNGTGTYWFSTSSMCVQHNLFQGPNVNISIWVLHEIFAGHLLLSNPVCLHRKMERTFT